jgi:hypothetical protein
MQKWVRKGVINCCHMILLLQAETLPASSADSEDVRKSFDNAITMAGKLGFLHNQALGNERAGVYFLEQGDNAWASTYLSRARQLFREWGAMAKVDQMDLKYRHLFESESAPRPSRSLKAQQRLSMISKQYFESL